MEEKLRPLTVNFSLYLTMKLRGPYESEIFNWFGEDFERV